MGTKFSAPGDGVSALIASDQKPEGYANQKTRTPGHPRHGADKMTSLVQLALWLAGQGLPLFPRGANKRASIAKANGGNGFLDASTGTIARLFTLPGTHLIGVPTGDLSGFDALDLDYRHDAKAWEAANLFRLPETRTHRTRSDGRHYLFRQVHGVRNSQSAIAASVDVRGTGGYIIWWPAHGCTLSPEAPIFDWPEWLSGIVRKPCIETVSAPFSVKLKTTPAGSIGALIEATLPCVRGAPDGAKHVQLRNEALLLGGLAHHIGYSHAEAIKMLLAALSGPRRT
jgi:hypothetical protein